MPTNPPPSTAHLNNLPLSNHAGLAPRVYFQVCGADILREDSLIYAEVLREVDERVEVKVHVYEGAPHVFWGWFGLTGLGRRWKKETEEGVGWLLGREGVEKGEERAGGGKL